MKITKVITKRDAREMGKKRLQDGACTIIGALNAARDSETHYRYSDNEIEKFKSAMMEIMQIVERGEIILTQADAAKNDSTYQKFRHMVFNKAA